METLRQPGSQRSFPDIMSDLFAQLTTLISKEAQLARAEISENVASIGRALAMVGAGAVLLIPALVILLEGVVAALGVEGGLAPYWAAVIVGAVVLVLGLILLTVGLNRMKSRDVLPSRTVHQIRRDVSVAKEQVRPDHEPRRAA